MGTMANRTPGFPGAGLVPHPSLRTLWMPTSILWSSSTRPPALEPTVRLAGCRVLVLALQTSLHPCKDMCLAFSSVSAAAVLPPAALLSYTVKAIPVGTSAAPEISITDLGEDWAGQVRLGRRWT